jgi:hypothetical protein
LYCQEPRGGVLVSRYISPPARAYDRVQSNAAGRVVLKLKTPW